MIACVWRTCSSFYYVVVQIQTFCPFLNHYLFVRWCVSLSIKRLLDFQIHNSCVIRNLMILPKMKAFKLSVDVIYNNKKLGKFRLTGYSLACSRETFVSSRYFFSFWSALRKRSSCECFNKKMAATSSSHSGGLFIYRCFFRYHFNRCYITALNTLQKIGKKLISAQTNELYKVKWNHFHPFSSKNIFEFFLFSRSVTWIFESTFTKKFNMTFQTRLEITMTRDLNRWHETSG